MSCCGPKVGGVALVRKYGATWIGRPYPDRIVLRWLHPDRPRIASWPGCGCLLIAWYWWAGVLLTRPTLSNSGGA